MALLRQPTEPDCHRYVHQYRKIFLKPLRNLSIYEVSCNNQLYCIDSGCSFRYSGNSGLVAKALVRIVRTSSLSFPSTGNRGGLTYSEPNPVNEAASLIY